MAKPQNTGEIDMTLEGLQNPTFTQAVEAKRDTWIQVNYPLT